MAGADPAAPTGRLKLAKRPSPLDAGDVIEYGATMELGPPGEKVWLKYSVSSTVRPDETSEQAHQRVTDFVETKISEKCQEWLG